jgi:hypothetical protein
MFSSNDQIIQALTSGQSWRADFTKNMNPTAAAVANECHLLARGNGNPSPDAIFDAGTNLAFQPVKDTTTNAGCILHGGNVQGTGVTKHIANLHAVTSAATVAPCSLVLVDIVGFYRTTTVTTVTAQATTNTLAQSDTFTADAGTDTLTYTSFVNLPSNILTGTRVQLTTTTTLPAGLATATNYYVIRLTDGTCKLATSYANSVLGTAIDITSAGTGTHTITWLLPRYTNGAGLNAMIFNPSATALGAGTPNMSLVYTNSAGTGSKATPTVLPVGKTGASNSHIIYTGATAAGKYNFAMPRANGDSGIAQIDSIQNSTSYVSGSYTTALYKELARVPLTTLGVPGERNLMFEVPSLPRVYDGACLYWVLISGVGTPANSTISGFVDFIYN